MSYLNETDQLLSLQCKATTVDEFLDINNITTALKIRSVYQLKHLNQQLQSSKANKDEKMNDIFALDTDKTSKLHIEYMII